MIDTKISPSLTVSLFCGIKVKRTITKFAIGILLFLYYNYIQNSKLNDDPEKIEI